MTELNRIIPLVHRTIEVDEDDQAALSPVLANFLAAASPRTIEVEPEAVETTETGIMLEHYGHSFQTVDEAIKDFDQVVATWPQVFERVHATPCFDGGEIPMVLLKGQEVPQKRWIVTESGRRIDTVGTKFGGEKDGETDQWGLPLPIQTIDMIEPMRPLIERLGVVQGMLMHQDTTVGIQLDGGTFGTPSGDALFHPAFYRNLVSKLSPTWNLGAAFVPKCENQLFGLSSTSKLLIKCKQTRKFFEKLQAVERIIEAVADVRDSFHERAMALGRVNVTMPKAQELLLESGFLKVNEEGEMSDTEIKRWDDVNALAHGRQAPSLDGIVDGAHVVNGTPSAWGWAQGVTAYETHINRIRSGNQGLYTGEVAKRQQQVFTTLATVLN